LSVCAILRVEGLLRFGFQALEMNRPRSSIGSSGLPRDLFAEQHAQSQNGVRSPCFVESSLKSKMPRHRRCASFYSIKYIALLRIVRRNFVNHKKDLYFPVFSARLNDGEAKRLRLPLSPEAKRQIPRNSLP